VVFLVEWIGGSWEATAVLALIVVALYGGALWLALAFWTFRDVSQRTTNPVVRLAGTLVVLAFFLPGLWLYLAMRPRFTLQQSYERALEEEAFLQELERLLSCPRCKRRVREDFIICPCCKTRLKDPCSSCSRPLDVAWTACPFCTAPTRARPPMPEPARAPAAAASGAPAAAAAAAAFVVTEPAPAPAAAVTMAPAPPAAAFAVAAPAAPSAAVAVGATAAASSESAAS
jgi:hypothetical protein